MRKLPKEVVSMHNRRKSDESIEITAYILKYKTIDEQCIDDVSERVNFIEAEISKRRYSVNQHAAIPIRTGLSPSITPKGVGVSFSIASTKRRTSLENDSIYLSRKK